MALPRHHEPSVFDRANKAGHVSTVPHATGRPPTKAESQRRYRAGHRALHGAGHPDPYWEERRNGIPWKPYRYRGTGRDAYDGTCLFEELAS